MGGRAYLNDERQVDFVNQSWIISFADNLCPARLCTERHETPSGVCKVSCHVEVRIHVRHYDKALLGRISVAFIVFKIEIMRDSKYLLPDNFETIKATEILAKEGFIVMPYMYPDLNVARDLANAGAACIMPLGAPIGSNKGICTKEFIQILIDEIDLPIIVDAGIGRPSQACEAMEMGAAAVMANTAVATAGDVEIMAEAFKKAIEAGRMAYLSGLGRTLTKGASASSPLTGYLRD